MVDFLFVIIDFFTISYGWDVISGNRSKSAFFKGGRSLSAQISEGWGRRPPTTVGVRKLEWLPFCVVSKYLQCIVWFCHKTRIWRTDGQTEFRQQYRALHYMPHSKNCTIVRSSVIVDFLSLSFVAVKLGDLETRTSQKCRWDRQTDGYSAMYKVACYSDSHRRD